jgi:excisionase family DNA binding protein
MNPDHIGTTEAAKILGVTTSVINYHVKNGNLPIVGRFGNAIILSRQTVEAFAERRESRK